MKPLFEMTVEELYNALLKNTDILKDPDPNSNYYIDAFYDFTSIIKRSANILDLKIK